MNIRALISNFIKKHTKQQDLKANLINISTSYNEWHLISCDLNPYNSKLIKLNKGIRID